MADVHSEGFALAKAELLAQNPKLREETIDLDGSTQNAVCHAIAVCNDEFVARNARELEGLLDDPDASIRTAAARAPAAACWGATSPSRAPPRWR